MTKGQAALTELKNDLIDKRAEALKCGDDYRKSNNTSMAFYMNGEASGFTYAINMIDAQLEFLKDKEWIDDMLESLDETKN